MKNKKSNRRAGVKDGTRKVGPDSKHKRCTEKKEDVDSFTCTLKQGHPGECQFR